MFTFDGFSTCPFHGHAVLYRVTLVIGALLIMDCGKILDGGMQLWPVCIFPPNDSTLDFCVNIFRLLDCYFQQLVIFLISPLCEQRLANIHIRM